MRIQFERTGGFAGMRVAATIDTDSLEPEAGRELQALVEAAKFFDLPAKAAASDAGTDQFHYTITVEAEGRQHRVEASDPSIPESLQPLLRRLTVLARSARQS
jgi:hypothetical protein